MPSGIHNGARNHRRKHPGDNHWSQGPGRAMPQLALATTAFEDFIAELGVPESYWHQDRRIARWVHAHKNSRYVPEHLLDALHEKVLWDGQEL